MREQSGQQGNFDENGREMFKPEINRNVEIRGRP